MITIPTTRMTSREGMQQPCCHAVLSEPSPITKVTVANVLPRCKNKVEKEDLASDACHSFSQVCLSSPDTRVTSG